MQMQHQPHHQLHHQANHQCHCPKYKLKLYHHIMTESLVVSNRDPINNRDTLQRQPGIQLPKQSAKSANLQGKVAITADKSKSLMPQQARSGRRVQRPKCYED